MLRSILMIFISDVALNHGIVTHVSELSQNLLDMNEKFWAVWADLADFFRPLTLTSDIFAAYRPTRTVPSSLRVPLFHIIQRPLLKKKLAAL